MSSESRALKYLNEDEKLVHLDHVVRDYRLVEKPVEKKSFIRQYLILGMLIFSITLFLVERLTNNQFSNVVEEAKPLEIDSILVEKNTVSRYDPIINLTKAPESVLTFIGDDVRNNNNNKKEVIIYEIVDKEKNETLIISLLAEAKRLFREDKLTSPVGKNAFEKYESVIAIDATHQGALKGIEDIVNRYVYFVESVIKKGEIYKVAGLIRSAHRVGSGYVDMKTILNKYADYIKDETVFLDLPKEPTAAGKLKLVSSKPETIVEQSLIDVDKEIALTALRLIENDDFDNARLVLENFSAVTDFWGESHDLLLKYYLQNDFIKEAETLVYKNKTLDLFLLAEKVARIFIAANDIPSAISLLSSHSPKLEKYQEYYALKAGLYHKIGDYDKSIELYQKLLNNNHKNSRYWLGLAVSLDALDDDKALGAFRYADKYSASDSDVKEYIEQRILVLAN
ncbi:MAG: tetratricopeptide repeat protein [Cellvibrionaceae bacterium]